MKAKTIKSVLRKKIGEWLESIEDEAVRKLCERDALVTGGSIASMLMGEKVNDFDVYFTTRETTLAVAKYYVEKFKQNPPPRFKDSPERAIKISVQEHGDRIKIVVKSAGIAGESGTDDYQYFEQVQGDTEAAEYAEQVAADAKAAVETEKDKGKPKYRPVFLSSNAISLSHDIQIVIRFYGPADQIHENYDFVHCMCSWEAATGKLTLPPESLEAMLAKEFRYKRSKYPLCSIIRTRKFLARDWRISAGQYVKMAWDLNALDLTDMRVLEDQMIGVDSAYFQQVIDLLKKKLGDSEDQKIDGTYLFEVIDKVF